VAIIDYFPATLAADGNGNTVKNATAQVYALADTNLSTPLALTDLQGVPMPELRSSDLGIYPAFRVVNQTMQIVVVSGSLRTPMTSLSVYANAAEAAAAMASGNAGAAASSAQAAELARQNAAAAQAAAVEAAAAAAAVGNTNDTITEGLIKSATSKTATALNAAIVRSPFGRDPLYPPADIRWPLAAHPAPPKITMSAANPPAGATTTAIEPPDARLLIGGTALKKVGNYYQPGHLSTADNFTIPPYRVSFYTDTDIVKLRTQGVGFKYRLLVDGMWAHAASDAPATTFSGGGFNDIILEFTTRKVRLIEFELAFPMQKVLVKPDATVWAPKQPKVRAIHVGDSFTLDNVSGDSQVSRLTPYPVAMGRMMGWDSWVSGVGGSGYLATGGGTVPTFRTRLNADVIAYAPDVVVWAGGHNDGAFSTAAVRAEARACWEAVAAALPDTRQMVVSPFSQYATITPEREALRAGLALEAAGMGLPYLDVLSPNIWTGTGKRGATTGNGNSDYYVNGDGVHPTPDGLGGGASYIAVRLVQLLKNLVQDPTAEVVA
jgi:lysophospholipase L1-like esterase